jgi:hypothetical protein
MCFKEQANWAYHQRLLRGVHAHIDFAAMPKDGRLVIGHGKSQHCPY